MSREARQYTETNLYGPGGRPLASDIDQDRIFNCYFLAPIGVLGEQQPDRIRDAIRFNPETGDFAVRLYRPPTADERSRGQTAPVEQSVTVSQDDLRRNIEREKGGSAVDNRRDRSGALWPAVLEAGFAELYGRDSQGRVNLNNGYNIIGDYSRGGALGDGMYALTGDAGERVRITIPVGGPSLVRTGSDHIDRGPPPFSAPASPASSMSIDDASTRVEQALAAGKPVSMSTQGREANDGLMESHAYMVLGVTRDTQSGDTLLRLRNPYGTNQHVGEGNHNVGRGWNSANPEITVRLRDLVDQGSLGEFNIGPAPRVQTQAPQPDVPAVTPGMPNTPAPPPPGPHAPQPQALLNDSNHPDHNLYQQVLAQTMKLPRTGRAPGEADQTDQQLSAALAVKCKEAGMGCVSHVVLSKDGSRAFAVDTPDITAEWRKRADVDVADAIRQPLDSSTERLTALNLQLTQQTQLDRQQPQPGDASIRPTGPSVG